MYALAQVAMRSRWHAAIMAGGLAGIGYAMFTGMQAAVHLSLPVALLLYASGAIVGLANLRNGPVEAILVLVAGADAVANRTADGQLERFAVTQDARRRLLTGGLGGHVPLARGRADPARVRRHER